MKIYIVGGAVRDMIMGVVPKDIDYVVVGATPEEMLVEGYEQVGSSFPVFLKDGCEYALARTERKTGVGYNGFSTVFDSSITLEDDLLRRDLTINAMAYDPDTKLIIDPYNGRRDIEHKMLRHTSDAFAEDPVRVLRTARFAARYGFTIDPDTVELMSKIVPEIDHVPAERVFAEFQKGLSEDRPYAMIDALIKCKAERAKAVAPYIRSPLNHVLKWVSKITPMYVRFALVMRAFADNDYDDCKIPTDLSRVSKAVNTNFEQLLNFGIISADDAVRLMEKMRVFSDPDHASRVFDVIRKYIAVTPQCNIDYVTWKKTNNNRISAAGSVDAAAIAASCTNPKEIRDAIFRARVTAIKEKEA